MSVMTSNTSVSHEGGSIKKMIRDTTRLLNRPNLPADLRREQERKLQALKVSLVDRQQAETERQMAVKYRMVKFFERKKALRRLASAQASKDSEAVSQAQLDLAYILHFPKDRKYISLYPETGVEASAERDAIRKQISDKLALMGAESMLAKVNKSVKKVKTHLQGSDDEEDSEDEESEEEGSDEDGSEEDGSDNEGSDNEGSDIEGSEEEGSELSYDEDSEDDMSGSDNEDDDSDDDDEDDDSEDDDEEVNSDDDGDSQDSEDEDSENDSEGSELDSEDNEDDEEEDSEEEDSEEEEDAPKPKKGRNN
jgi:hypothetical protein